MKKITQYGIMLVVGLVLSGCYTTGLSLRETRSYNFTNFLYGLYEGQPVKGAEAPKVQKPIKLAVAQIGENTAPQVMLDRFREESNLITAVETIPAGGLSQNDYYDSKKENDPGEFSEKMQKMRALAQDLGSDYLLVFGGTADYGTTPNFLQVFDITIIGAYILPSTKHSAEGRASGALIDTQTGRVVFMVNSESKIEKYTPSYMNYYDGSSQILADLRDDLVQKLSDNFVEKISVVN